MIQQKTSLFPTQFQLPHPLGVPKLGSSGPTSLGGRNQGRWRVQQGGAQFNNRLKVTRIFDFFVRCCDNIRGFWLMGLFQNGRIFFLKRPTESLLRRSSLFPNPRGQGRLFHNRLKLKRRKTKKKKKSVLKGGTELIYKSSKFVRFTAHSFS